jgi:predicted dithiol-disulfide oxidoreductase (DUF899 family)
MRRLRQSRCAYDHRLRDEVCRGGSLAQHHRLHIARSTAATWRSRGPRPVVTLEDSTRIDSDAFFRDGDDIYRTYFTSWRGLEVIGPVWSYFDRSLLGRQETREDSTEGWPRAARYRSILSSERSRRR